MRWPWAVAGAVVSCAACALFSGGLDAMMPDAGSDAATEGSSACGAGRDRCDNECVDLRTDNRHCGQCGIDCSLGGTKPSAGCVNGSCVDCGPQIDFQTDPNHCGRCGHSCLGSTCMNGSCDKQLVAAMDRPLVVAADKAALYVAAQDTKVYVIDKEQDGGFGIPVPLLTIGAYTLDLRSFPGGVGIAHTNGASLVYRDGGFATVNGYEGVYGCAVHASSFHWTTCYGSSTVKRSLLDGGGVQTLATDVGSSDLKTGAQALVVDNDNAYWTNTATRLVMQVSLDGGAPQAVSPMSV